jgi:Zn-dependent peptidase ImmA (M78 family)
MPKLTVNELLVTEKIVRERLKDLKELRTEVASLKKYYGVEKESVKEPQYDVKKVDQKITELQNFLMIADQKIKKSNAVTKVEIEIDINKLLSPLE